MLLISAAEALEELQGTRAVKCLVSCQDIEGDCFWPMELTAQRAHERRSALYRWRSGSSGGRYLEKQGCSLSLGTEQGPKFSKVSKPWRLLLEADLWGDTEPSEGFSSWEGTRQLVLGLRNFFW